MAAKEASHLKKEVPRPFPPSLVACSRSLVAAILSSLISELINSSIRGSLFRAKYAILPISVFGSTRKCHKDTKNEKVLRKKRIRSGKASAAFIQTRGMHSYSFKFKGTE